MAETSSVGLYPKRSNLVSAKVSSLGLERVKCK